MKNINDYLELNRHLALSTEEREHFARLDGSVLPLNARLVWEFVRPVLVEKEISRVLEDNYFLCAESGLKGFLNESQIEPYYVQLCEWLNGKPISDESAISFRRMGCHRSALTYIFEAPGEGCRIGCTTNLDVKHQFQTMRRKYPQLINRLVVAGNKATSLMISALFAARLKQTEHSWFDLTAEDFARLHALCARESF